MRSGDREGRGKVVFVNRYFFPDQSATSQMLTDLAFGLAGRGFEVHIVCSRQRYGDPRARLPAEEKVQGVLVHRVWTSRFGRESLFGRFVDYLTFYLACGMRLVWLLRRGDVVVAKTDPPLISIVAWLAASLKRAVLVNWLQDVFPEVATRLGTVRLPRFVESLLCWLRDVTLRSARVNVVLGVRMREFVERRGILPEKIHIIENWAGEMLPLSAADSQMRSGLGLAGKFVVGYSGNLGLAHEFDTLLGAAALLEQLPDVRFLMIGGGAGMKSLQRAVEHRQLNNFIFAPFQDRERLADSMAAADLHWVSLKPPLEGLIVPSKFYGIMAARRPVIFIGDPAGEVALVLAASDTGVHVQPSDSDALAKVIVSLKGDQERCRRMADNGRRLYSERFVAKFALERWQALLSAYCGGERA